MASLFLALAAVLVALAPAGSPARKGFRFLDQMVDECDLICIGRVENVLIVPMPQPVAGPRIVPEPVAARDEVRIARVAVERWIKGSERPGVIHHEAWGTWTCDTTHAEVGERAVLFLCRKGEIAQASENVRSAVHLVIGSDEIYRNYNSGDGILRILDEGGSEYVGTSMSALRIPGEDRHIARLTDVVRYVEDLCRFPRDSVRVLARSGWSNFEGVPGSFDLRVLASGEARLATDLGAQERVRTFSLDSSAWQSLERELQMLAGVGNRAIGEPELPLTRELVLRTGDATLTFVQPTDWSPPEDGDLDQRLALEDALRAWALVRELASLPEPDPHAKKDRHWLGSGR
jgi:hypothetical protein